MSCRRQVKKKILFAIPDFRGGGAERVFLNIIKNISRDLYEIHLLVGCLQGQYSQYVPNDVHVYQVGNIKAISSVPFIIKVVKKIEPDILFSTLGYVVSTSLASIFFPKNTKCIVRFGNTITPFLQSIKQKSLARYLYQYIINKLVFYFSDLVIVQSEYMKNDLVSVFNLKKNHIKRVIKINNPLNITEIVKKSEIPFVNEAIRPDKKYINFVSIGRLDHQKGYDNLIKAFKIVYTQYKNTRLTILGEGALRNDLENLINSLNLQEVVLLPGFLENPYQVISKMDFFVSSSLYEGMSNAILESLALGVPVIATDCPSGIREVIFHDKNGWLVKVDGDMVNNLSNTMEYTIKNHKKNDMNIKKNIIFSSYDISSVLNEYNKIFLL